MKCYLFPFAQVPQGSRLVLYGAGSVGQDYYRQIKDTGWCQLVLWLDKNADGVQYFSPETICEWEGLYDWVLIAVSSADYMQQMQACLTSLGIPASRVLQPAAVLSSPLFFGGGCRLRLTGFIRDDEAVRDALYDYFLRAGGDISFFAELIDDMREASVSGEPSRGDIQQRTLYLVEHVLEGVETQIVILRLLYEARLLNTALYRVLVNRVGQLRGNAAQREWLLQDLTAMWFHRGELMYDEYWAEVKAIRARHAAEMALEFSPPPYDSRSRAVCVVAVTLADGSVSQAFSVLAKALTRQGYQLHLFDLVPHQYDSSASFLKPSMIYTQRGGGRYTNLRRYYPEGIELYFPASITLRGRQQETLALISQINPCYVIDLTDETVSLSWYLYQYYPTVLRPLRRAGQSSLFFHKVLFNRATVGFSPPIQKEQLLDMPLVRDVEAPERAFSRADMGFSDEDILVVTVGGRLLDELSDTLVDAFCEALGTMPSLKWLCVGTKVLPRIQRNRPELVGKQVFLLEYEPDLPGLYTICDIFLNPLRDGGGLSITWAMQQGLALVSPVGASAGLAHIGAERSVPTEADLVPQVLRLARSPELLCRQKEDMRRIAATWDINNHIGRLVSELQDMANHFHRPRDEGS